MCAASVPVGSFFGPGVVGVALVEKLECGPGVARRFGVGAAEVRCAHDIVERFGDARVVWTFFGESEHLGGEPVRGAVELGESGPFFFRGFCFGFG